MNKILKRSDPNNNYIDIPFNNSYFSFSLFQYGSSAPIISPTLPVGIGVNQNALYDLGCIIDINNILSNYNLSRDDCTNISLYLFGTQYVGDIYIFKPTEIEPSNPLGINSRTVSTPAISPSNYDDYVISIKELFDESYNTIIFRMVAPLSDRYSVFDLNDLTYKTALIYNGFDNDYATAISDLIDDYMDC